MVLPNIPPLIPDALAFPVRDNGSSAMSAVTYLPGHEPDQPDDQAALYRELYHRIERILEPGFASLSEYLRAGEPDSPDPYAEIIAEAWLDDDQSIAGAFARVLRARTHAPNERLPFRHAASIWEAPNQEKPSTTTRSHWRDSAARWRQGVYILRVRSKGIAHGVGGMCRRSLTDSPRLVGRS